MGKFATGFPITGVLSQAEDPPSTAAVPSEDRSVLSIRLKPGFGKDPQIPAPKMAQICGRQPWEREAGLDAPSGCIGGIRIPQWLPPGRYNIAFRFGVEQASKLRAYVDLRRILTNSTRTALTPTRLASRGHLPQLFCRPCDNSRDWALFKADHEASYKKLPLAPGGQAHSAIALMRPVTGKWFCLVARTLVFGGDGRSIAL